MKITTIIISLLILSAALTYSQSGGVRKMNEAREEGSSYVLNTMTPSILFTSDDLVDPVGTVTNLMTFADYVTNGNNLKKLAVIGDTVIVTGDYLDSNWSNLNERKIRYNVSYNGGVTWGSDILIVNSASGQAYGDLSPVIVSTGRTVTITGRQYAPGSRAFAAIDLLIGLGVFTNTQDPEPGQDYFSMKLNTSQMGGSYRSGDTIRFVKYNYLTNIFESRVTVANPPTEADANGRYTSAVSSNGQNIFVMWWVGTSGSVRMVGKESTNGGTSFGPIITVMPYPYVAPGGDSVSAWFGMTAIYKPNTTTKMAAFNTLFPGNFGTRRGSKLMFWSPGINGGNPVTIADWHNTSIPLLNDSLTFENSTRSFQTGMTHVSHATLGYTDDGSRLICVFSGAQPDTSSYGFNFNDIYESYSDDNGATWSQAKNITNTPNVDEIYPSISQTGNLPGNMGVTFQVSDCPGSSSFTDTQTPRCRVYWVYRRYDPVTGNLIPIGIKNISGEVPEKYSLLQNYPNPFNPETKIKFQLPKNDFVSLKVYDALGRIVATIVEKQFLTAGVKEVEFNASNLSSGVYFYRIEAGDFRDTKKMMLIK